jgi:hypothetical protein
MAKKKALTLWALWNYDTLFCVEYQRKKCREFANGLMTGGKPDADKMFRTGAFRIGKVAVREL